MVVLWGCSLDAFRKVMANCLRSYKTCSALLECVPLVLMIDLELGKAFVRAVRASLAFDSVELLCRRISRVVEVADDSNGDGLWIVQNTASGS